MIERCALSVILDRGRNTIPPTLSELDADEAEFLNRHVNVVRDSASTFETRGRFRDDSTLPADLAESLNGSDDDFVEVADRLMNQLAKTMQSVSSLPSCVLALVVRNEDSGRTVTLLKLDADIEAAQLDRSGEGVRLRVFKDLLPRPGEIQKGMSWPDPRDPQSQLVILDKNMAGTAKYFQNAYRIDASPSTKQTELALVESIASLPALDRQAAIEASTQGGSAEVVVKQILAVAPSFIHDAPELGSHGALAGYIRPDYASAAALTFEANGITLKVPLDQLTRVETKQVGTKYVTTIETSVPLFPTN